MTEGVTSSRGGILEFLIQGGCVMCYYWLFCGVGLGLFTDVTEWNRPFVDWSQEERPKRRKKAAEENGPKNYA